MIVFGAAVTDQDIYDSCAKPGIDLASEPDSENLTVESAGSIYRNYNLLFDQVKDRDDVEALVLVHQDAEIVDPDFCSKVREVLSNPEVAIAGGAGAIGVRSIAWWEGAVVWAAYTHKFMELGGGDVPAMSWRADEIPSYARTGFVDMIDGFVMAFSPWAFRNLRFDESLGWLHGYDFDICMQAREAGRKVAVADLRAIHHHSLELISDPEAWITAHMRLAEKWHGRVPDVGEGGGDWRYRARRAEAEASAARMVSAATEILSQAQRQHLIEELRLTKSSPSWKVTKPLRGFAKLRDARRRRNGSS
jgi:hypothetical protein